jgi:hypothetical protein
MTRIDLLATNVNRASLKCEYEYGSNDIEYKYTQSSYKKSLCHLHLGMHVCNSNFVQRYAFAFVSKVFFPFLFLALIGFNHLPNPPVAGYFPVNTGK